MINWTRALGCALLLGLCSCGSSNSVDGGVGDGGPCNVQSECVCTCVCSSGAHGTTYSECVSGYCSNCAYYCNAFCS